MQNIRLWVLLVLAICLLACSGSSGGGEQDSPQPRVSLNLTISGQGDVTLNPAGASYPAGTIVTVTATPMSGWQFDQWSGGASGDQNPLSITVNSNLTVSANFIEQTPDTTAPNPDPMTWETVPTLLSSTSVSMTATVAVDSSSVEYFFRETSGNAGGTDSGWQSSPSYIDSGLSINTDYTYQVKARDQSANLNETGFSTAESITTPNASAGISKGEATMRLAGMYSFDAIPSAAGGTITWSVDQETRSEATAGNWTRTNNLEAGTGSSFSVLLSKITDQETVYYITARDDGFVDTLRVQVFPENQTIRYNYDSAGNPSVPVYIRVPASLSKDSHLLSIHHGTNRNADIYISRFDDWAQQNDTIAVAPLFTRDDWPSSRAYNQGNLFSERDGGGTLNPESEWAYTIARDIAVNALEGFGLDDTDYDAWGHSAGGQFVHRMLIFRPDAPIRYAMPANPGWWTVPDVNIDYPYGLKHPMLNFTQDDVLNWTERNMIIYRGTEDTQRTSNLRQTPEADLQGLNRYERAGYMYDKGLEQNNTTNNWELNDVQGVGHSSSGMAPPARAFLESNPNN